MLFQIVFTPEAENQLADIYRYLAVSASPEIAQSYTDAIVAHCEKLRTLPHRGAVRDDIRPGLRITVYRKRVVIAFVVDVPLISVIGVYSGGQDYEAALQADRPD